ncbi:arginine--tRNA ligase [Candidatus Parcubacteria bacterium]|nr:arginine--tRNA ligase [Candidatus Parcubacteria bacterium]
MQEKLYKLIEKALNELGASGTKFSVEHPTRVEFGDYSTNAGITSKKSQDLAEWLESHKPEEVDRVEQRAGFINFYLSSQFFAGNIKGIIKRGGDFGRNESLKGEKVMVEYTDANPFKELHIGHLMSNAIGEAVARVTEWSGAEVKRANYQGDVGLHVAKAIWGMMKQVENPYAAGAKAYTEDEQAKQEIEDLNKKIYEHKDLELNALYESGKKDSLDKFEQIYKKLGTKFDRYFFESETAPIGKQIVEDNMGKIFDESEGAVVFHAEKFNPQLHTRVFINSQGLPTYEAKELGLTKQKFETEDLDQSIVITANEQTDYFRVVLEAVNQINPRWRNKMMHLAHGVLRLPSGKMSSRTGEVISAESLINEVKGKTKDDEAVAVGAIKYMILRSNVGGDIIFDVDKSVSTEGDSGVYLQYAHARANSVLEKADKKGDAGALQGEVRMVERLLYRFPEIVLRSQREYAPHFITTYLTELASSFNNFYAHEQVISDDAESPYRLAIVEAFKIVMKNGLTVLGMPAPEKM